MPIHLTSRFIEHLDGPIIPLDSEAYEASFALDLRSCPDSPPVFDYSQPLTPTIEPNTPPADLERRLSELHLPPSQTPEAIERATLSPTSMYSRSTGDDKPFTSLSTPNLTQSPLSSDHKAERKVAYFVFRDGDDVCDSRHLFEATVAPSHLLVAALAVLTGEGSLEDIKLLDRYRLRLPILKEYIECLEYEERDAEAESGIDGDWLRSQKAYQERELVILRQNMDNLDEEVVVRDGGGHGFMHQGDVELLGPHLGEKDIERGRGRSLTSKLATAAENV